MPGGPFRVGPGTLNPESGVSKRKSVTVFANAIFKKLDVINYLASIVTICKRDCCTASCAGPGSGKFSTAVHPLVIFK